MASFRLFVAFSALLGLEIYICDVNTSYLYTNLEIPKYVDCIQGHVKLSNKAFKVKKALYGLRQAGREWNTETASLLWAQGFKHGHRAVFIRTLGERSGVSDIGLRGRSTDSN